MSYDNSAWNQDPLIRSYAVAATDILASLKMLDEKKAEINSLVPRILGIAQKYDTGHNTPVTRELMVPPYNGCKWWLNRDRKGELTAYCTREGTGSDKIRRKVIYTTIDNPGSPALENIPDVHASMPGFLLGVARTFPMSWQWWGQLLGVEFKG